MCKDNLKIFTRVSCFLVLPSGEGVSAGVVCCFPTALGANPIQASKNHNVLTISWIQFQHKYYKINIYTNALKSLMAVMGNVHIGKYLPIGGCSIPDYSGKGFVHLTVGF